MDDNRIINDEGLVAMRYYRCLPHVVTVNKNEYYTAVQYNVALAWVKPEDVDALVRVTGGCCGKKMTGIWRIASANDVSIFNTGHLP